MTKQRYGGCVCHLFSCANETKNSPQTLPVSIKKGTFAECNILKNMKNKTSIGALLLLAACLSSCSTRYELSDISRSRILIDKRYDAHPNATAEAFISPYRAEVEQKMTPVVGETARYMASKRPESDLSNLLSDILMWSAEKYGERPDFSVYNMGGIRAAFGKGKVTLGDVLDVAPFENKICFLTLSGAKVNELLSQIAMRGGEGVSHGVEMEITKEGKLRKALINGNGIDESKTYRVVTLDYLAQGNDKLTAFKSGTDVNSPQTEKDNIRFHIAEYFKAKASKGEVVDSRVEGRIKIVE